MNKFAALLIGLSAFGSVFLAPLAHAAGSATITLSPTNVSILTDEMLTLSVIVDPNGESLDTVRVVLDFDPSLLEGIQFDLGSQFASLSPGFEIDNDDGEINFGAFQFGDQITARGTLATVTFRALSAGSATVRLTDDSKAIDVGEEKIDESALGSVTVTITGETVAATGETETSGGIVVPEGTPEEQALVYFGALVGRLPSSSSDWDALHCMAYDTCKPSSPNTTLEAEALVVFGAKYGRMPSTSLEWSVLHAIAYTDIVGIGEAEVAEEEAPAEEAVEEEVVEEAAPEEAVVVEEEASLEEQALVYFGALVGRLPSSSSDWDALHCMAYDTCKPSSPNTTLEAEALVVFGAKYGRMPSTSLEWSVLHAIAYTDIVGIGEAEVAEEEAPAEEAVVVEEEAAEEVAEGEALTEETAIGLFGAIYGRLPSLDEEWDAVHIMVEGYDGQRSATAEGDALAVFTKAFGRLPESQWDWNVIAAIAYSGSTI
jgi:uncharacterized Zn-binding protein involved in type VI secretion